MPFAPFPTCTQRSCILTLYNSNNHIQDVLLVSYLANTIRTQIDLSNRLATAALTMEASGTAGAQEGQKQGGGQRQDRQQGQRSGARPGGGRGEQ